MVDLRLHWIFLGGPAVLTAVAVAVAVTVVVELPNAPIGVAWVLAAMIAVPALWLVGRIVRWRAISLVVTTTRIVLRRGVLGRDVVQLRLHRVADVHCTQSVFDRVIGSGRLVIELIGDQPMVVDDVRRPRALQRVLTRQLDELAHGPVFGAVDPGPDVPPPPVDLPRHRSLYDTPPHGVPRDLLPVAPPTDPGAPAPRTDATLPGTPHALPTTALPATAPPAAGTSFPDPAGAGDRPPSASIPEQLVQLDELRRRGIVSEDEFAAKKAELLRRF